MTKPNFTEIVVVLDRSGSMAGIAKDMEGGFNRFIQEQRLVPGECQVSLYQFDDPDAYEQVYAGCPVQAVPPLDLVARGMTALYDAVAKTIVTTGERFSKMPEWQRPSKVVFMIITDGQENSSREYSAGLNGAHRVKQLVEHQEARYKWSFVYLGSNLTTHADATAIGVSVSSHYVASNTGARGLFAAASGAVGQYRSSSDMEFMSIARDIPDPGEPTFPGLGIIPPIAATIPVDVVVVRTTEDPAEKNKTP